MQAALRWKGAGLNKSPAGGFRAALFRYIFNLPAFARADIENPIAHFPSKRWRKEQLKSDQITF
jgi:hypothetical protein